MIYKILFLDDNAERTKVFMDEINSLASLHDILINVDYCATADKCIELLSNKKYDIVFLDHDLGGEVYVDANRADTGSEVARYISKNQERFINTKFILHSLNAVGRQNMFSLIRNNVYSIPFGWQNIDKILNFS